MSTIVENISLVVPIEDSRSSWRQDITLAVNALRLTNRRQAITASVYRPTNPHHIAVDAEAEVLQTCTTDVLRLLGPPQHTQRTPANYAVECQRLHSWGDTVKRTTTLFPRGESDIFLIPCNYSPSKILPGV